MTSAFTRNFNKATRAAGQLAGRTFRQAQFENISVDIKQAWQHQVDEAAFLMSYAAYVGKENAKEKLFDAALSYPGQFFIGHAGIITSTGNITANILLGTRFIAPAVAFFAQDPGWQLNNLHEALKTKAPEETLRFLPISDSMRRGLAAISPFGKSWAGSMALLGSSLFLYDSWRAGDMHGLGLKGILLLGASNLPGMAQSLSAIVEKKVNRESGGKISFPMLKTTLGDLTGMTLFTVLEGLGDHPLLMASIGLLLMTGDVGILCQDSDLLASLDAEKARRDVQITPQNYLTSLRHG